MTDRINKDSTDEKMLERLFAEAGPRPRLNENDLAAVREAARQAWQKETAEAQRFSGRNRLRVALALAASLVAALFLTWWLALRTGSLPMTVATMERVTGEVIVDSDSGSGAAAAGRQLDAGSEVQTAADGTATIRLEGGAEVRFDSGARARLATANEIELRRGGLYIDTGQGTASPVGIRTSFGTARDIGTTFSVRVADQTMTVRVREGTVVVEQGKMRRTATAGSEIVVFSDQRVEERTIAPWGEEWSWVIPLAAPFDIEGRTLRQLLDWSAGETGWRIRFEDPALEQKASTIILHGTIEGLPPDKAPFAVLAGAGLSGELAEGELVIREEQR